MSPNTITPSVDTFNALKATMPSAAELSVPKQKPAIQAPTQQQAIYSPAEIGARIRSRNPEAFGNFTDEQIGERAISRKPELANVAKVAASSPEQPKKNLLQDIVQPITDTLATGYRTAQGLAGFAKAGGQALLGDTEGAKQTILEAGKDVESPVNIPFLGQGNVRKIGTVTESGSIVPSKETLKTVGTGLELGAFATPIKAPIGSTLTKAGSAAFQATGRPLAARAIGTAAKYGVPSAMTGFAAATGRGLAEGKGVGESLIEGAKAAPISGAIGSIIPFAANTFAGKNASKAANRVKAEQTYRQALGLTKAEAKREAISILKAKRFGGDVRNMPRDLLDEGVELKAVEDAGRRVFDTVDNVAELSTKINGLENQLDNIIATRPQKTFNLNVLRAKTRVAINNLENLTAFEKQRMLSKLDDIVNAELVANGYKQGSRSSMSKAAFIDGKRAQELKKGLYKMANYERQQMGSDQHVKVFANILRGEIENAYKGVADVRAINSRIGKLINMTEFLQGMHGKVVKGGMMGRKLAGVAGTIASQGLPVPILREIIGYNVGEKIADYIGDPARLTKKAIDTLKKRPSVKRAPLIDGATEVMKRGIITSPKLNQ